MAKTFNIIDAFNGAILSIEQREQQEKLKQSEPQLHIGTAIRAKLESFTEELEKYNREKSVN